MHADPADRSLAPRLLWAGLGALMVAFHLGLIFYGTGAESGQPAAAYGPGAPLDPDLRLGRRGDADQRHGPDGHRGRRLPLDRVQPIRPVRSVRLPGERFSDRGGRGADPGRAGSGPAGDRLALAHRRGDCAALCAVRSVHSRRIRSFGHAAEELSGNAHHRGGRTVGQPDGRFRQRGGDLRDLRRVPECGGSGTRFHERRDGGGRALERRGGESLRSLFRPLRIDFGLGIGPTSPPPARSPCPP